MKKPLILVIEDDRAVRHLIATTLEIHGYQYLVAETGSAAMLSLVSRQPDLLILDLGLPDMDGVDIIKKVRSWSEMPIIIVSARGEDRDKILALDSGADDYLTKPFSVDELLARLRVAFRRSKTDCDGSIEQNSLFINGDLKIDYAAGCVFVSNKETHLTPIEYKLLCLLSRNIGKVLTHKFILKAIWINATDEDTPSLRVFMATLRKKIENASCNFKYIQTHIGVGYRMVRFFNEHQ